MIGVTREGAEVQLSISLAPLRNGGRTRVLAIVRDITELVRGYDYARTQLERMSALRAVDSAIVNAFDEDAVLRLIVDQIMSVRGVRAAALWRRGPTEALPRPAHERSAAHGPLSSCGIDARSRYVNQAMEEVRVVRPEDDPSSEPADESHLLSLDEGYCVFPFGAHGAASGAIEVAYDRSNEPDGETMGFLENLGQQAAIAVDWAALLDGLRRSNSELRRAYEETIEALSHMLDMRDNSTHFSRRQALLKPRFRCPNSP